jgi:hypothetical protein
MAAKAKQRTATVQIDLITHTLLVQYCRERGIKLGHYVSTLIHEAVQQGNQKKP